MFGVNVTWQCEDCDEPQSMHMDFDGELDEDEQEAVIYLAKALHKNSCKAT